MASGRPAQDYFEEYITSNGEHLKVHPVPQHIVRTVKLNKPKPARPVVEMKTKTGTQKRWAKAGDDEWPEYEAALKEWETEQDELRRAVTYCLALRSHPIPNPLADDEFPDYVLEMARSGLIELPSNPWLRKFLWLRSWVVGDHDEVELSLMLQRMSGVPEDMVEELRNNFRHLLLGSKPGVVGAGTEDGSGEAEGDIQM